MITCTSVLCSLLSLLSQVQTDFNPDNKVTGCLSVCLYRRISLTFYRRVILSMIIGYVFCTYINLSSIVLSLNHTPVVHNIHYSEGGGGDY